MRGVQAPAAAPTGRDLGSRTVLRRVWSRLPRRAKIISGSAVVVVVSVAAAIIAWPQPNHVITTPAIIDGYARQSAAASTTALELKRKIIAGASGEVKNVVAAVYERKTGPGTSNGPQIIAFIGGNLAGSASAGDLTGAMASMRGSFVTSSGTLGGAAVCAPGANGGPAECTWADNDTFGVVVSATMSPAALAQEMRVIRPLVEHEAR